MTTPPCPPVRRDISLPPNPYPPHSQSSWHNAYEASLNLEMSETMHGRVLGFLMLEASDDEARDYVATGITKSDVTALFELAQTYIDEFLFLFFHQQGGAPYSEGCDYSAPYWFEYPSVAEEALTEQVEGSYYRDRLIKHWKLYISTGNIDPAPKTFMAARNAALYRDGKRSVISGEYDVDLCVADLLTSDEEKIIAGPRWGPFKTCYTRPIHIFPPLTASDKGEERGMRRYTFQAIDIVQGYGHINVMNDLEPSRGRRLSNVMTVDSSTRRSFNHGFIWFEHVSDSVSENTYYVDHYRREALSGRVPDSSPVVTFTTTDDRLELPDPRYLKLHAAVCRIAYMSGAYSYIWQRAECMGDDV